MYSNVRALYDVDDIERPFQLPIHRQNTYITNNGLILSKTILLYRHHYITYFAITYKRNFNGYMNWGLS